MKTKVSQITLRRYIDLLCGDTSVLLQKGDEAIEKDDLQKAASNIIYEYNSITYPSLVQGELMDREEELRNNTMIMLIYVLRQMLSLGDFREVKERLTSLGHKVETLKDVKNTLDSLQAETDYMKKRIADGKTEVHKRTPDEIRQHFDSEIAFLMVHYKMNIDIDMISAGIYANMLRRAISEVNRAKRRPQY